MGENGMVEARKAIGVGLGVGVAIGVTIFAVFLVNYGLGIVENQTLTVSK
jgi:hypothetical protein